MSEETTKLDISDETIAERRSGPSKMPDDMPKWMASTIIRIDRFSKWTGNIVCWITIPLILAMVYEVLARKLFTAPTMWAYDMSRFLFWLFRFWPFSFLFNDLAVFDGND